MRNISSAKLIITLGKNAGRKINLEKDAFYIGTGPDCDLILDFPSIEKKEILVKKSKNAFIIKSLTDKRIPVSGEEVFEKILNENDIITIGNIELKYVIQALEGDEGEGRRLSAKQVIIVAAALFVIIGLIQFFGNIALLIQQKVTLKKSVEVVEKEEYKKKKVEKKQVSEDKLINLIANGRKRIEIADSFYKEKNVSFRNHFRAIIELRAVLDMFKDVEPKPQICGDVHRRIVKIEQELQAIVNYLKKNAYVAYQQGNYTEFKYILEMIMTFVPVPISKDHIWAKNKYIELVLNKDKK